MKLRIDAIVASLAAGLLLAATAHAQPYSLTGRVATGSGQTVRLPAAGTPCGSLTALAATGINTMQTFQQPATVFAPIVLNPLGCIPGSAASVTTTGSGGFMLPGQFFSIVPMFNVVPVPLNLAVPQLATSFAFTGPYSMATTSMGGMFGGARETLAWRKATTPKFTPGVLNSFGASNHLTPAAMTTGAKPPKVVAGFASGTATPSMGTTSMQARLYLNMYKSGRTSANFTACAQPVSMGASVACTFPTQGTLQAVVKNIAGPRVFGGSMGLVLNTGTANVSNLGVTVAGGYSSTGGMNTMATRGSILFNVLMGMGSRAAGRGYAAYDTDYLAAATIHATHMLTTINMAAPYYSRVVGNVGPPGVMLPAGTNMNHAFPWTTGTQVIRGTGKSLNGGPGDGSFSVMGYDARMTPMGATGMGGEGNIQLVSGALSAAFPLQPFGATANYSVMRLEFAPEPGAVVGLLAGAGLLGLVAWRRRTR